MNHTADTMSPSCSWRSPPSPRSPSSVSRVLLASTGSASSSSSTNLGIRARRFAMGTRSSFGILFLKQ